MLSSILFSFLAALNQCNYIFFASSRENSIFYLLECRKLYRSFHKEIVWCLCHYALRDLIARRGARKLSIFESDFLKRKEKKRKKENYLRINSCLLFPTTYIYFKKDLIHMMYTTNIILLSKRH